LKNNEYRFCNGKKIAYNEFCVYDFSIHNFGSDYSAGRFSGSD